jgi:hypothetical protein
VRPRQFHTSELSIDLFVDQKNVRPGFDKIPVGKGNVGGQKIEVNAPIPIPKDPLS